MTIKRPSKPSGEHPAVQAFRAKIDSINETTMPMLADLDRRIDRAVSKPPRAMEGEWTIVIKGYGALPPEANRLAAGVVRDLRVAGHVVASATLTHGSNVTAVDDTSPPPSFDDIELEPDDD